MVMSNVRKETKYIVIYHTGTKKEEDINSYDLERKHRLEGYLYCKYHKVIKRDGEIENARDVDLAGCHMDATETVTNKNSIAICLVGGKGTKGKPEYNFTEEQEVSLKFLVSELKHNYTGIVVVGHGDMFNALIPTL